MRNDIVWPAATCIAVVLAITAAISLRGQHGEGKREELREALRREAASPYGWCDLGEALLEDGQKEQARYCFQLAEKLAPNVPPIWMWAAAFFHFQMEENEAAIQCSARVPRMAPDYDEAIFNYYDRLAPNVEAVLPHLGDNRRAGQAYFRHLLGAEAMGAATAWEWLRERRFADDGLAARHLDLLLKQRMTEDAVQVWASYLGRRRGDCPGFQYFVQRRFREPADRRAGLEDYGGARRGDGEGRSGRQKRPVVTAYFVPGSGKLELPAHGPDGVRTHGGIRLPGLRANARSDHRGGNPVPHLRSGVERAIGRLYGAIEGDERLDTAGDPVQGSGGHTSDPGLGLPPAVMEIRQQDQGRGVAG
jgi:hypothetical protein